MNKFWTFIKSVIGYAIGIITILFTFVPESFFTRGIFYIDCSDESIIIINRLLWLSAASIASCICLVAYKLLRTSVTIRGNGYRIVVEYGDIFNKPGCKKVIGFDECFTTTVGDSPSEIKPTSICGQFLVKYPDDDFLQLIQSYGLEPNRKHSDYKKKECYKSGSIVPFKEYLLLAFTKLDKDGLGRMSRTDFLHCLENLWIELDKYYADNSVAIPVLGSGVTRFKDEVLSQQQLLDMIIASYKLSPYKLKSPSVLYILCRRNEDFSLNRIGEYI